MTETSIYNDIAARTGGALLLGVVGPVRTGKSTFIKRFMETLVIPRIEKASTFIGITTSSAASSAAAVAEVKAGGQSIRTKSYPLQELSSAFFRHRMSARPSSALERSRSPLCE